METSREDEAGRVIRMPVDVLAAEFIICIYAVN